MRDTPYLAVDEQLFEANLTAMAEHARQLGVALRPHAKTHKSAEVARRQLAHGAVGLTVATVSEAEIFADAGFDDLFIAYPIWAEGPRAPRLQALAGRVRLRVGVDSIEGARMLAHAVASGEHPAPLAVAVEVDSGHHRTGVAPDQAGTVAAAAAEYGLRVDGVFTFPGHSYAPEARASAAHDEALALEIAREALLGLGLACPVVSGGSTPSADAAEGRASGGVLTELRPGVYPFFDAQQWELGTAGPGRIALTAVATVVSVRGSRVVVDAGNKVLGADRAGYASGFGRLPASPEARIVALSEHHATIEFSAADAAPALGSRVRIAPNHVCAAINLADELVVEQNAREVTVWTVDARGANT
ncbi:alanine racemase [Microcella sp.]|uniref:alanine racemase n=1 Tax=Microcella sp. TaxID=1913979 RepID=UPI0025E3C9FC|nr:alanine racemase [Microcella sp.]